jgi:hypothetical protein
VLTEQLYGGYRDIFFNVRHNFLVWEMMKIKKLLFAVTSLFFLFLVGCSEDNTETAIQVTTEQLRTMKEEFKSEISRLELEINEKDKQIKELQKKTDFNNPLTNSYVSKINGKTAMIDQLVKHLPDITHKEGYIKEVIKEDTGIYFMIDYAKMVHNDGYSPNNFHIENEKEEYVKVKAVQDIDTYVRDGAILYSSSLEKYKKDIKDYKRLFDLYFIEDKLVLAVEMYLP